MCAVLVLGSVRGVGEGFVATLMLADIGFLPGVRAQMSLQVLQAGVGLGAALELQAHTHHMGLKIHRLSWNKQLSPKHQFLTNFFKSKN